MDEQQSVDFSNFDKSGDNSWCGQSTMAADVIIKNVNLFAGALNVSSAIDETDVFSQGKSSSNSSEIDVDEVEEDVDSFTTVKSKRIKKRKTDNPESSPTVACRPSRQEAP